MMKRRGFLGMMAASPFAAKQVAEEASMKLAGVSVGSVGNDSKLGYAGGLTPHSTDPNECPPVAERSIIAKLIQSGIPEFKLEELKRYSRYPSSINPNTASLKSVSLVSKINMQAKNDFEKSVDAFKGSFGENPLTKQRDDFYQKHGWWL